MDTHWHEVVVPGWHEAGERPIENASDIAVWRHGGMPVVPNRRMLSRGPKNCFSTQALLATAPTQDPEQIIAWFVRHWCVEVTFRETRAHLGV